MRLWSSIRVVLLGLSLAAATAMAADGSAKPPFRFYTVVDGLTQSEVRDIAQDQAGYLWFTTARGLNRYDGKDFDQFTISDGLPTNSLTALYVSDTNSVWVGDSRGGITAIHGARVVHTIGPESATPTEVLDIEFVGDRKFVVYAGVGIVELTMHNREFGFRHIAGDESMGITDMLVHGTIVWVVAETGLYELVFGAELHLELRSPDLRRISIDGDGTVWALDKDGAVGIWRGDSFDALVRLDTDREVVDIAADDSGLIWAATRNELFRINQPDADGSRDTALRRYTGIDGILKLFVDNENSVWLANNTRLIRFLGDRFTHYELRTGDEPETIWSISEDHRGRFWFGTDTKLLLRKPDESLQVIGTEYGIPEGPVRDIVASGDKELWLTVRGAGLYRFDVDALRGEHIAVSGEEEILDIAVGADGAVWYATLNSGVFRYTPWDGKRVGFAAPQDTSVYTLDVWPDGSVWYGADDVGLVQLTPDDRGGYFETLVTGEGMLANHLFNHVRLSGRGSGWVATEEGGLYRFGNGQFTDLGSDMPFADQTIYVVEPLSNGTVVVGGEQGLYQFVPGEEGVAHYNYRVGFAGMETNVHATLVDSQGQLWIGTVDGATLMDTSRSMPGGFEPTPMIVRVETQLDRTQVLDGFGVEPNQLGVHVEFAAVSLLTPRGMRYSYKLVGIDDAWGPETSNRSVSYPRIPPGDYEFMVRARYPGGAWSRDFASHRFTVQPFIWQQPVFIVGIAAVVLLLLRAIMVYRTRSIEWANEKLREEVEQRTRSIEMARRNLEASNEKLSREIEARAEVETRFRRAFENAPIGMGILDADGVLLDANPSLKNMFWPEAGTSPEVSFADVICDDDRQRFARKYQKLVVSDRGPLDEKLACIGPDGEDLQTVVNLSTVRSERGAFLYTVLQIQDVTEALKLTVALEHQASSDELTGLLNRRAFETQLKLAWERGSDSNVPDYLMFMDLDQFKVVNDTSGHTAGDELLRGVTELLVDSVRANDIVARLGGDEFGIILWECPTEVAERIAESIRAAIENFRFHWDTETYRIGVSIGGLPVDPSVGDISEIQQLADAACYAAKEEGRNRVHMVAGDRDSARVHRGQVRWVQRLREAMDNNRFAIYGQPIHCLDENQAEPERMEILLRLREPDTRKLIPPGAFLPAAERYGLSVELDMWVVRSLLKTLFVHQAFHAEQRSYWVNLSGTSIGDQRFAVFLKEAMVNSPLPPGTINFEITETAVIRSVTEAGKLMSDLREMGCQFALDDFGSGLSSFAYLKKLPIDFLKIDGAIIRDLMHDKTDRIFVRSIIDIAHTLNIKTIAEFVENDELLDVVRGLGADYAQGFVFGRPYELAPQFYRESSGNDAQPGIKQQAG